MYELFGGGTYKARGLDEGCRFSTGDTEWVIFEGPPKPFGPPPGPKGKAAPTPAAPPPVAPSAPATEPNALAAAIAGLTTVVGNAIAAFANRPVPPPPPPPDNSVTVALIQSQASLMTAMLNKPPDNATLLAVVNGQTELTKAMLSQKPPQQESTLQIAEALSRIQKGDKSAPATSVKDTVDTFKALKDVMGGGDGGKSEIAEIVGGVAALAHLETKSDTKEAPPRLAEPERRRSVKFRHPQYGNFEIHDPTPELLELLASQPSITTAARAASAQPISAPAPAQPIAPPAPTPTPSLAPPAITTEAPAGEPAKPVAPEPAPAEATSVSVAKPEDAPQPSSPAPNPPVGPGPRMVSLGGVMVEHIEEPQAILLGPGEPPPISDEDLNRVVGMDPDVLERAVVKKFGPKSAGIGDAMRAVLRDAPLQAHQLLRAALPPDALRALANGAL